MLGTEKAVTFVRDDHPAFTVNKRGKADIKI
jgi:hypothetical protein